MLTKEGYFHMYDIKQAKRITINKISTDTIVVACPQKSVEGIMAINTSGQLFSITVNEDNLINFILHQLKDPAFALSVSATTGLTKGIESTIQQNFDRLLSAGNFAEAAKAAAESPNVSISAFHNETSDYLPFF